MIVSEYTMVVLGQGMLSLWWLGGNECSIIERKPVALQKEA